jgi:hypothetical protein
MATKIMAKFAGRCCVCGESFPAGTMVLWEKGRGSQHVHDCKPAVKPVAVIARRANSRCPNPRNCGDPTCDGSCGY